MAYRKAVCVSNILKQRSESKEEYLSFASVLSEFPRMHCTRYVHCMYNICLRDVKTERPIAAPTRQSCMGFDVLDAQKAKDNTAVARIGFDNDGFMSTTDDGGSWGPQFRRAAWQ